MRHPLIPAILTTALLSTSAVAQQVFGGPDPDRQCSTVLVFDDSFNTLAGISISYGQPEWKAEYNAQFDKLTGQKVRLGKNWWTTFDTVTAVEINGKKVEAGSYFLGLECTTGGKFHLLLIDSMAAMKGKMVPFNPTTWKGETKVPLKFGKDTLDKTVEKMEIEVAAQRNKPSEGSFAIRWGEHQLTAALKLPTGATKK